MKQLVLGVSALALAASLAAPVASAADLPARNLPVRQAPVALIPLFAGLYGGFGIGGGWSRDRFVEVSQCVSTCGEIGVSSATGSGHGALGSAHMGFSWNFNGPVLGVEGDIGATSIRSKRTVPNSEPDSIKSELLADASLRARIGYAFGPILPYITGGVAFGQIRHTYDVYSFNTPYVLTGVYQTTHWRTGWTLGAGVEWAFAPMWTARVEYRYTDFGKQSDTLGPPVFFNSFVQSHREKYNTVRFGVSRYF